MTGMAKIRKYRQPKLKESKVEEPLIPYTPVKKQVMVADYTYKKLKKITELVPFTQKEWANMLHLSERTLQRYAKDNTSFEGIYVDRILHLEQMIHMGLETFIKADAFYNWLKREKHVLGNLINFESLYSTQGINDITEEL